MSFGNEKLARLLEQPDVAYDDRLSVCKALADVSTNVQNAIRITESSELIHSMASILNSTHNPHIDVRHQIQVCLTITRCVVAGRDRASIAFSKSPGLIEGLCTLKGDSEPFLRVSASCALRLLSRCDEACGSNRRLLRSKWHNVLKDDSESFKQERAREKECEKSMHLQGPNESEMHAAAAIANSHELPGANIMLCAFSALFAMHLPRVLSISRSSRFFTSHPRLACAPLHRGNSARSTLGSVGFIYTHRIRAFQAWSIFNTHART